MFERYVPKHNSNVTIIFYEDMDYDSFIDLDKEKLTIPSLTLDAPSYIAYKCSFKFGNSVGDLNVNTVKLNFIESEYHMQKGTFEILSSISGHYDLCNFTSLYLDYELFLSGNIKEYQNDIEINCDSSNYQIKFTSLGIDVIDDKSKKILFQIDVEKFPKCTVIFKYNPIFEIEDGLVETKPIYLMRFRFIKYFILPASWEKVTFTNHVNFEVIDSFNLYIISSTYNFDCWDIMNKYPIQLDQKMSSFDIFGTKTLYNNNITMKMYYSDAYRNYFYDIDIVTLDMTGNSSFNTLKDYVYADQGNVLIFNLRVLNGVSNIGVVEVRTIQVYPGSRLNCLYNLSAFSNISYISLYWDLNQPPVLFSRLIQNLNDCPIYIQYKGSSIRKRKKLFDNFLANGTLIMTNIANVTKERINFVSDNITEFNDGDDLALEIRYINNDIYMFSTRQLYNESEVFETDTPSQSPSESNLPSPTPSDTATASFSPEQTNPPTEELISSSLIEISRTQKPSFTEPIIENYQSNNETIIFESNGYRDGDDFVPVKNDDEIALINSNQQNLFLKINENGQTNNALFLSPQNAETTITIAKPPEGRNDYGEGEFGVHANSNNPVINLPQAKVPLNLFNNQKSEINLNVDDDTNNISLNKLTIIDGNLKISMINNVKTVEFEEIESFSSGKMEIFANQIPIEAKIKSLKMNSGSTLTLSNINFDKNIKVGTNSNIYVLDAAKFNDQTEIELTDSSLIEFGESLIDGTCKQIKITEKTQNKNAFLLNDQIVAKMICGAKFNCSSWIGKYQTDEFYKYPRCIDDHAEKCLAASNKNEETDDPGNDDNNTKKPLSKGIIIAIVVVVVVVIIAIIVGIIIYKKKNSRMNKSEDENNENELDL